jgi:hypothetical protein
MDASSNVLVATDLSGPSRTRGVRVDVRVEAGFATDAVLVAR